MTENTTNDFYRIVINEIPLIDVRAPIEFEKGAFLTSVNLPFMNTQDRHLIGIRYKEKGHEEAIKYGHELVCGEIRQERTNAWVDYLDKHPDALLYCFRGGSRSQITQEWIKEASGKEVLKLEGGYKAFRNYLIDALNPENVNSTPIILGGYTGSGKTRLLHQLDHSVDLEGIANHRGSSFGQRINPQPPQISFENNLAYAMIQHEAKGYKHIILEDEGRHIGVNFIPKDLTEYFQQGDLVILEVPFEERVQITLDEYVVQSQAEHIAHYGEEEGLEQWVNYIHTSIGKAKRKLGGLRYQQFIQLVDDAFATQRASGQYDAHQSWIEPFLTDYYDPMYKYQLETTTKNICFRGNKQEVLDYLNERK